MCLAISQVVVVFKGYTIAISACFPVLTEIINEAIKVETDKEIIQETTPFVKQIVRNTLFLLQFLILFHGMLLQESKKILLILA